MGDMKKKISKRKSKPIIGRPPTYRDPSEMADKIVKYFSDCPDKRQVVAEGLVINVPCPTISGLALYLGFCDRYSFYEYEKKPAFTYTIKTARAMLTRKYEANLDGGNAAGSIFMLKNLGYTDKTEIEHTGDLILNYGHRKPKQS